MSLQERTASEQQAPQQPELPPRSPVPEEEWSPVTGGEHLLLRQASRDPPLVHMEEKSLAPFSPSPPGGVRAAIRDDVDTAAAARAALGNGCSSLGPRQPSVTTLEVTLTPRTCSSLSPRQSSFFSSLPPTPPPAKPPTPPSSLSAGGASATPPLVPPGSPEAAATQLGLQQARRARKRGSTLSRLSRDGGDAVPSSAFGGAEEEFLAALLACDELAQEVAQLPAGYVPPAVRARATRQRRLSEAGGLLPGGAAGTGGGEARTLLRARADMGGSSGQELRLRQGELFELVSRREAADDGWWIGERCGVEGLFPARLAEVLAPAAAGAVMRTVVAREALPGDADYLAYAAGELLEIVSQPAEDVWIGVLRGITGIFSAHDAVYLSLQPQVARLSPSSLASTAEASPAPSPPPSGDSPVRTRSTSRTPPRLSASLDVAMARRMADGEARAADDPRRCV